MRKIYLCLLALIFQFVAISQPITIGTGTSTSSNSPWNVFFAYSYVQTIYLGSEINATGNITSVQFYYAGTAIDVSDDIVMYMSNTTKSSFATTTDWEPLSNMTQVFSGIVTGYTTLPGTVTVTLTTPFAYTGGNLLIAVDENKVGSNGATRFQGTLMTGTNINRTLAYSNDNTNPDPAAPLAGTRSSTIGNIVINGLTSAPCQSASNLTTSNITLTGVSASWTAPTSGNPVNNYQYEVRTSGAAGSGTTGLASSGTSATTSATITGLAPSTTYTLYIRPDCGAGNFGSWLSTTFNTLCGTVTSFTENFDGALIPALPNCWKKVGTSGTTNTQTTNPQSAPNCLYIFGTSATVQCVVSLPPISNAGAGTHQFKYSLRANFTAGGIIQLGYLTNPNDSSTFVVLKNDTANSLTYKQVTFKPTGITGANVVFAIRHIGIPAYSVLIDDFSWQGLAVCAEPSALVVSAVTTTSATTNWTAPSTPPASYEIYRSTSNTAPTSTTTPTATGITATNYSLTGLTSATKYYYWVRSNCGVGGTSIWSVVDSFTTSCLSVNIPYTQDFESATVPAIPTCTSIQNAGTGNNWVTVNNPGNGFTTKTLRYVYNATNAANAWFYTQGLNLTAGTSYTLTFKYGNNSTTYVEKLKVSYGNAANASAMTTLIVDYPAVSGGVLSTSTSTFTPSTTGVYYIGFNAYSILNQFYLYVDDIAVTISPSCVAPTALNETNVTTTSATANWTAPTVAPSSYEVYRATVSTAPTSTTTPTATGITATNYSLTGLTPATKYFYWVRSNCGAGGVSAWSSVDSFTTASSCNPPTALNETNVTTTSATANWTAPATAPSSYEVYHATVSTAPTSTTTPTATGITATNYSLTGLTPATKYFYWVRSNCGAGNLSAWSVADSLITTSALCDSPSALIHSNVTTTGAKMDWTAPTTGASSYELYSSTSSTAPTSATTPTVTGIATTTYTFTGLISATKYFVWVRSSCTGNIKSSWSVADSFTTACLAVNIPYTQDFESATVPALPNCTSIENVGTGNLWTVALNPGSGFTSKTLRYAYNATNAANVWFYTQGVNLTAGTSYRMSFRYGCNSATYTESMKVSYGTSANAAAMTTMIIDYPSIKNTTPNTSIIDFIPTTSGIYYFGFNAYSIANQFNLYVDDISVTLTPACDFPTALNETNVTTTGATLNWTAPSVAAASYEVYHATVSIAPTSTTTPTAIGITATNYNLTGLTSATKYYYWVRSNCGANGVSTWSIADSFTTECLAVTSFYENFDAVTVPAFPNCWGKVGTTGLADTRVSNPLSAPNCMYIYSTTATNLAVVKMIPVSNAGLNTHQLRFSARGNFTAGATIQVGYLTNPSDIASFVSLQDVVASTLTYQSFIVIPGAINPGQNTVFAFRHTGTPANSVLIDDVYWEPQPPTCTEPTALNVTNITLTGATLNWIAPAVAPASYEVYYATVSTAPTSTTAPTATGITATNYVLTGLTSGTKYFYWVRSNCSTVGTSVWSVADSFTTSLTCDAPTALISSNVTGSGAQLDWTAPVSGSPAYELYTSTSSSAPSSSTTPTTTGIITTTYNLTGLLGSTKYFVWVRSNCGTGNVSAWSNVDSFTTQCGPTNIPYVQDFESAVVPAMPPCTSIENLGTGNNWVTANNPGSGFVSKTLRYGYNATNAADVWFFTQGLNLTAGTSYRITFRYGCNSATYTESMKVSYGGSPNAASMTDLIVDYPSIKNTIPANSVNDFTPSTTGVYYIGFHAYSIVNQFNLYVDDINVVITPTCDVPSLLPVTNILSTGATLNWNPPTIGTPSSYDIYYSTSNVAPTSTTTPTNTGVTNTTFDLTALSPSTKYYYWLRTNCGAAGYSVWGVRDSFITACVPVATFSENFATAVIPALPNCWTKILRGATLPTAAFVNTATTNVYSAPNAVSMYNSSATATDDIILVSPAVTNLSAGTYQLSFFARNSVAGQDVEIGTLDNNSSTATFTPLQTVTLSTAYQKYSVSFATYTGTDVHIGIRRLNATTFSYVYLDDITWELIPACFEPSGLTVTNITATGAQLDWTAPSSGTPASYEIYYSTTNTAPTSTTIPSVTGVTTTTYNLSGLTSASAYYVWVRSNCGTGGVSGWSAVATFITECVAVTDFYQNFDAVTIPALPVCWGKVGTTGNLDTRTSNPQSAPNTMYIYGTSATNFAVVRMTPVSNAGLNTHRLRFSGRGNFSAGANIQVGYLTDPNDATTFTLLQNFVMSTLTYQSFSVIPGSINPGGNTVFAFKHTGTPANSVLIDDVYWEPIPGCVEPTSIVVSNITQTSAQVDWTPPTSGSPLSYDVYFSTSNTPPTSTTTPSIAGVTSTTANLTGLSSSTVYYVWVRSNCGATLGYSNWTSAVSFPTLCGVITAPTAAPETFATAIPPNNCWSRAQGILANPTAFTSTTTSNWVLDDFTNRTTPVNKSAKINIYTTTRRDWLITPVYDLGTGGNFKLEFDLGLTTFADTTANTLGPDDKFAVVISTDNGATWSDANILQSWDATTPISSTGEHVVIDLGTYTGTVMFGFYGESTVSNADNDLFVDNVEVLLRPFPVTLISFKGEKQGMSNLLTWSTATEQNNKGFELQRSLNGENFTTVAFIKSKSLNGNSNALLNYNFIDSKPANGNNYYRLKQVDLNGRTNLSNIVLIKGNNNNNLIVSSVYPNPAKNDLNLTLSAPSNDNVVLLIADVTGRIISQQKTQILSGDNNLKINVSRLLSGTYILKIVCKNGCDKTLGKFVKE